MKYLQLIIILLYSCKDTQVDALQKKEIISNERVFMDSVKYDVTIIENSNVLRLSVCKDFDGTPAFILTTGHFKLKNDTLCLYSHDFYSQKETKKVKAKYFGAIKEFGGYYVQPYKSPQTMADSLFKKKFDFQTAVYCYFKDEKAIIKNGQIHYLQQDCACH